MKSVAIIGAGITGLTAAFRLSQKGIDVTVYEAGSRVGGVIQSIRDKGFLAECGPNTIIETSPKITSLVRDLGLEKRKLYTDPNAEDRFIVRGGKPVHLPASQLGFFKTHLFSPGAKARLFREPFIHRAPAEAEENLEQFVLRRLGREMLDYAINPFVAGVYAGDPARLSVKHAFPKLHALEQKYGSLILGQFLGARERKRSGEVSKQSASKFSFDEGLEVLTDELRAKLAGNIELQTPVTAIERNGKSWIVTSTVQNHSERHEYDAVLFTAPTHKLESISMNLGSRFDLSSLKTIYYPPVTSVVLGFRREDVEHPCNGFGALVPEVERFKILGVIFSSALFPNRAPKGQIAITCYVGGSRNPELALQPPEIIRRAVLNDLEIILGVRGQPVFEHQFVYRHAIPQYEVGYGKTKELMNNIERNAPGFFFAGHFRDGIALGDSIVSGDNAAERLEKFFTATADAAGVQASACGCGCQHEHAKS